MKYFIYILAIIIALGLEAGIFTQFSIQGAIPDLILLMVIYLALKHEDFDSFFIALIGGLFMDAYVGLPIGTITLGYLIIAGLIHGAFNSLIIHELTWKQIPIVLVAAVALLHSWMISYAWLLLHFHWGNEVLVAREVAARILPSLLYNLLLFYPAMALYSILDKFINFLQKHQQNLVK